MPGKAAVLDRLKLGVLFRMPFSGERLVEREAERRLVEEPERGR